MLIDATRRLVDMNNALTRQLGFWLLAFVSVASAAFGGSLIVSRLNSMNTTLLDQTATAADVYVGQSLVVVGSGLLGAGILGILITLAVGVLHRAFSPAASVDAPATPAPIETTAEDVTDPADAEDADSIDAAGATADETSTEDAEADAPKPVSVG